MSILLAILLWISVVMFIIGGLQPSSVDFELITLPILFNVLLVTLFHPVMLRQGLDLRTANYLMFFLFHSGVGVMYSVPAFFYPVYTSYVLGSILLSTFIIYYSNALLKNSGLHPIPFLAVNLAQLCIAYIYFLNIEDSPENAVILGLIGMAEGSFLTYFMHQVRNVINITHE